MEQSGLPVVYEELVAGQKLVTGQANEEKVTVAGITKKKGLLGQAGPAGVLQQ